MARKWVPKQYFTPIKKKEEKVEKFCSNCKYAIDYMDNISIHGDIIFVTCPFDEDIPNQNRSIYPIEKILKLKKFHVCNHWELL